MAFMNEHDVEQALSRFCGHPVLGPATSTLASLMDGVNRCSDGWCYWRSPQRAAARLVSLITDHTAWEHSKYQLPREGAEATAADLRAAYAQLRRFRTSRPQCQFRIYGAGGVPGDPEPERPAAPEQYSIRLRVTGDKAVVTVAGDRPLPPGTYRGTVVKTGEVS